MQTSSKGIPRPNKKEWPETPRTRLSFRQAVIFDSLLKDLTNLSLAIIDDIFEQNPHNSTFPLGSEPIENYLSGFEIQFVPIERVDDWNRFPHFCSPLSDGIISPRFVEGFWHLDNDKRIIFVFFKTTSNPERQRFTVIHELFHACQSLDLLFCKELDTIYETSGLPEEAILYLLERATDKATTNYLMPAQSFRQAYAQSKNLNSLVKFFGVSRKAVEIRIEECCRYPEPKMKVSTNVR